jgi:hypothetical protein
VEVIDSDLGWSAAMGAAPREGFARLLTSVALGEVGLVLSREVSRLSRTGKDWCHLLEVHPFRFRDPPNLWMAVMLPLRTPTKPRRAARHRCQPKTVRRKTRSTERVKAASKASW